MYVVYPKFQSTMFKTKGEKGVHHDPVTPGILIKYIQKMQGILSF